MTIDRFWSRLKSRHQIDFTSRTRRRRVSSTLSTAASASCLAASSRSASLPGNGKVWLIPTCICVIASCDISNVSVGRFMALKLNIGSGRVPAWDGIAAMASALACISARPGLSLRAILMDSSRVNTPSVCELSESSAVTPVAVT